MRAISFSIAAACAVLPAQALSLPGNVQAMLGTEPARTFCEAGVPMPPTAEQVAALPPLLREQHRSGMKHVLLLREARNRESRYRQTPETLAACAGLAREWECPAAIVDNFQRRAEGDLSPRELYAWNQALSRTLAAYSINATGARFLVEDFPRKAEDWQKLAPELPIAAMFNQVTPWKGDADKAIQDFHMVAQVMRESAKAYATITDAATAKAAIPTLRELALVHDTTLPLRFAAAENLPLPLSEAQKQEMMDMVNAAYAEWQPQRQRLADKSYFGVELLPILDYLLR